MDGDRARLALARYGLTDPTAPADLRAAGWYGDSGVTRSAEPVLAALSRCADPDLALRTLDRLRGAVPDWAELEATLRADPLLRGRLLSVLGASTALGDALCANPTSWHALDTARAAALGTSAVADARELLIAVGADPDERLPRARGSEADLITSLRSTYRCLLTQIAAADLGHLVEPALPQTDYAETTNALTDLADAALRAALAIATTQACAEGHEPACRLAVIAMGKCGGRELNYVSDVDVVFVAEGDLEVAAGLAAALSRIATAATFEVDVALRPEGNAGALVRTLDGHLRYYQRWARTWEFQALLKARPVAGDLALGRDYLDALGPLVWVAADRENFVAEVQSMRRRVEKHVPAQLRERELKLGRGGLRDVEFAVQLLQLVHGRADENIRQSSTMAALAALGHGGYVGRADAVELGESYRFLRALEHRLQLQKLRRTHLFPTEEDAQGLRWLARAAGIKAAGGRTAEHQLQVAFRKHAARVRRLHEKLFYRPLLEAVSKVPSEMLRLTERQAEDRLAALGYASPQGALQQLDALTAGVSRRAAIQSTLLPAILGMLADTPDPDGGLLSYRKVSDALADTPWYLRLLRDEGAVVQRLSTVLGTSRYVPDLMVRAPEALRLLADDDALLYRDPAEVASSLRSAVRRHSYLGNAVTAARSLRRHELVRIGSADVLGEVDVPAVCAALSSIWSAVLAAVLDLVDRAEAVAQHGRSARIAVIGMGRLGGGELGYSSDADVLFVCEPLEGATDQDALTYASRVAQTTRRVLASPSQDPPLQVDADLRPEGRSGPLVRTLSSYLAYYRNWSDRWEHQALLRAGVVAGDAGLGARFLAETDYLRYPAQGLDPAALREIRRIKARVETERLPRGADAMTNTKLGRGGLSDVEWTVQALQLQHAAEHESLRTPATLAALSAARAAGLIDEPNADTLREAWLLATKVRNATMLVRGKPSDQIPLSGRELAAVATICGYGELDDPGGEFLEHYRRSARHARAVVDRVFYGYPD